MIAEDAVVGSGHGIEHLMIVVGDLAAAVDDFRHRLGFQVVTGTRLPDGIENASIELQDEEYLELLAVYDEQADSPNAREIRALLSKGEGACGFGIQVSSIESTANRIRANGFDVIGPSETKFTPPGSAPPVVSFRNLQVKTGEPALDEVFFFTEPQRETIRQLQHRYPQQWPVFGMHREHPNGAIGQLHPWLAVSDLDRVAALYASVGFRILRDTRLERWGCSAREFKVGAGSLLLLGSGEPTSAVTRILEERGSSYAIPGVTLAVNSFGEFKNAMNPRMRSDPQVDTGLYGRSLLIPPDRTHGLWLELIESGPS